MKRFLFLSIVVVAACKKGGAGGGLDLVGTWTGDCKSDDESTSMPCTVTVEALNGKITPIHVSASTAKLECDGEGLPDSTGKRIMVMAPKGCSGDAGTKLAQYSVWSADGGKLGFRGNFNEDGSSKPFGLHGDLDKGTPPAKAPADKAGGPPAPPSAPPPAP